MTRAFVVIALLAAGCTRSQPADLHAPPVTASSADSVSADTASADSARVGLVPPIPDPGPAPGTVVAVVAPLGCTEDSQAQRCRFRVESVRAYGAATLILTPGQTLEASVSDSLLPSGADLSDETARLVATLQHSEGMGGTSAWRVLALAAR